RLGDALPVLVCGGAIAGKLGQHRRHLVEGDAAALRRPYHRDTPDGGSPEPPLVARSAFGTDEAELFVEPQRRGRHSGPARQLADADPLWKRHPTSSVTIPATTVTGLPMVRDVSTSHRCPHLLT